MRRRRRPVASWRSGNYSSPDEVYCRGEQHDVYPPVRTRTPHRNQRNISARQHVRRWQPDSGRRRRFRCPSWARAGEAVGPAGARLPRPPRRADRRRWRLWRRQRQPPVVAAIERGPGSRARSRRWRCDELRAQRAEIASLRAAMPSVGTPHDPGSDLSGRDRCLRPRLGQRRHAALRLRPRHGHEPQRDAAECALRAAAPAHQLHPHGLLDAR